MRTLLRKIVKLFKDDVAATTVEYAVMLMLIIGMCITAIQLVGGPVQGFWANSRDKIDSAVNQGK